MTDYEYEYETTEIHDRQSPRIANILATNLREAKTTREETP